MMEQQFEFELDGVRYVMTPANAFKAWNVLKKALKIAQGVSVNGSKTGKILGSELLAQILANLGDPSVKEVEDLVLSHATASVDGKTYRLSDRLEPHFNQYRHHLIGVLARGVKYQFADFFKNGQTLLKDILPLKETA
jgi:uncharacterized protein PD_1186